MADSDIQALLDPGATGRGITMVRREPNGATLSYYYCQGNVTGVGKAMWVAVTTSDSDAQKNTAIRAAFGVA